MYGASKTYNNALSRYLSNIPELFKKIDIISVAPGFVRSQLVRGDVFMTANTDNHARAVFNQLGYTARTYGHYYHDIEKTSR